MVDSWGARIVTKLHNHRWFFLVVMLLLTGFSALQLQKLTVDNSVEVWFPTADSSLQEYKQFQEKFGNDEQVIIGVDLGQPIASVAGLELIDKLTTAAAEVEGIAGVTSVVTIPVIDIASQDFDVQSLKERGFDKRAVQLLLNNGGIQKLMGKNDHSTILLAQMETVDNIDVARDGIVRSLQDKLQSIQKSNVFYGGIGIIYVALNEASTVGAAVFIVVSYILIALLLWGLFRRVGPMILTLVAVGTAAVLLMGMFAALGNSINMVNMILPTLTLVIGVSGCVHMLMHVAQSSKPTPMERVKEGIGFVIWPCLFNMITTSMGFLALGVADMPVIQNLGFFGALGLLFAFSCGVLFCAVASSNSFFLPKIIEHGIVQRVVNKIAMWGQQNSQNMLFVALLVMLLSGIGISRLEVDTYSIEFLKENHSVRNDSDWLEENYGPYTPVEFVVRSSEEQLPKALQQMASWQKKLQQREDVGYIRGLVEPLQQLQSSWGASGAGGLPDSADAVEQLLFLYSLAPDSDIDELLQREGEEVQLRMSVGIPMMSAKGFSSKLEELQSLASFSSDIELQVNGYIPLYIQMMKHIVSSQLSSFALAFVIIFIAIGALFRSFRMAILSVPANLLPVMMTLGLMGLLGIRLDVATVTIAAIVLGLVVDDTVQFLYRLHHEQHRTSNVQDAVHRTVLRVGQPMFITTIVLAIGFSVLGLAAVKSVAYFGLLLAFALLSALFSDLLVLPAMLVLIENSGNQNEASTEG